MGAFTNRNGPNNRNGPGITGTDLTFSLFSFSQIVQGDVKTMKIHLGDYVYPMVCVCVL